MTTARQVTRPAAEPEQVAEARTMGYGCTVVVWDRTVTPSAAMYLATAVPVPAVMPRNVVTAR